MARIAVVEDKSANLDLLVYLLAAFGHQPLVARNGVDGVALVRSSRPDLVLMDVRMPVMDGLQATAILKADPEVAGIPIVALTAAAMAGDRAWIMAAGFDSYLTKPIEANWLRRAIDRYVGAPATAAPRSPSKEQ